MDGALWIAPKKISGVTRKDEGPPKFSDQTSEALSQFQGIRRSYWSARSCALRNTQLARLSHAQERISNAVDR
jgi:hypothetical protein